MRDWNIKKTAKILIKRAKQNPRMYTKAEIWYAKMIKKRENDLSHQETEQSQQ